MLYWVGPRDSDIDYTNDVFNGMITLFGSEGTENSSAFCKNYHSRVNHNIIDEDQDNFTISEILKRIKQNSTAKFLFYNPNIIYKIKKLQGIRGNILALNDETLMEQINNKIKFHELFETHVNMLECKIVKAQDCSYNNLIRLFDVFKKGVQFVVQAPVASGGYGTFLLNEENDYEVRKELVQNTEYLVSIYLTKSISVNGHLVIFDDDILSTPCSVQIMKGDNNRLFYRGADFITYRKIPKGISKEFEQQMLLVGKRLQKMGYRGVCGVDGIIENDNVYILEVNNRFQASTPLINLELSKIGLPSLHELNIWAFENKPLPDIDFSVIPNLKIDYSNYIFTSGEVDFHYKYLFELLKSADRKIVDKMVLDGYDPAQTSDKDAYEYKVIFNTNITGISGDGEIIIHNNIVEPDHEFYKRIEKKELLYLKTALLNQGVRFTPEAKMYLEKRGGIRPGTNSSVDILLEDVVVNCPVNIKFSDFSPFLIDVKDEILGLFYYGGFLKEIKINPVDIYSLRRTSNEVIFDCIGNMSSDRLRLHHTSACIFKKKGRECRFCDIQAQNNRFHMEDVYEVIDFYLQNAQFDHFLVGGQSDNADNEYPHIIKTIKYIRERSDKNIYVMCLPPSKLEIVDEIYHAGATEIGFNIEMFDRALAKKIMPGKGEIPLKRYMKALERAVSLFGKEGNVRSMIIVGLEGEEILLKGIENLAKKHIQPILSVFRPLPNTDMYDEIPPDNKYLISIYEKANRICQKYGMQLGPACIQCQNNTLSMPWRK